MKKNDLSLRARYWNLVIEHQELKKQYEHISELFDKLMVHRVRNVMLEPVDKSEHTGGMS